MADKNWQSLLKSFLGARDGLTKWKVCLLKYYTVITILGVEGY